jgi:hypothetical protein
METSRAKRNGQRNRLQNATTLDLKHFPSLVSLLTIQHKDNSQLNFFPKTTKILHPATMTIFRNIIPAFLCLLVAIAADDSLASSSTRDTREVAAQPVMKQGLDKRHKTSQKKGTEDKKPYSNTGMQRALSEARTTLLNVDISSLTTEEYFFFEDTLREAYTSVYGVTVNSVIVKEAEKPSSSGSKKNLRGHARRALNFFDEPIVYFWFDIFALLEFTCNLCGPDDDDDDDDFYFNDDDLNVRKLGEKPADYAAMKTQLETTLCASLQESPFENFQGVQGCEILIAE